MVGPHGLPNILPHSTPHRHRLPLEHCRALYKSHGWSVEGNSIHIYTFLSTMTDLEGQHQPTSTCAWSAIATPDPAAIFALSRGTTHPSRHDEPPLPSILPCPDDMPPAYTVYPPISGSDPGPSESASNRTVVSHNLRVYATVIGVILTVALFATAVFFQFFDHSNKHSKV